MEDQKHFEQLYPANTRSDEIKKIIEILRKGRSAQVAGLPGIGRGTVLRLLPYNRQVRELHLGADESKFHFVYMDFAEVRGRTFFEVLKFIFISLSYSLSERRLVEEEKIVNDNLRQALEFQDELILFQGLKKSVDYLAVEKGFYLVFLFDRFEDYIPNIDEKFFLNLKILRNRIKYNFTAVFAVERPIEDTLEPPLFSEFHEFIVGNVVYLPINAGVGLTFRFKYLEEVTGKSASEAVKKQIEEITGGHAKIAKLAYESVLAADEKPKDLEKFLLDNRQIRGALFELWDFLTPEEQIDIKDGSDNEFLGKVGLLKDKQIAVPLFTSYLKTLAPQASHKLVYDAEKNEIKKGDESLTEKLTPSEFRLLKYLMINSVKVCEKDEIIQNVWKDSKTQEGVSDQALDQIIYRLRKKIEEDPNNPKFIQTVKGRGYKFNP